ncbi:MAG: GNAT family N-acetyltransferase [Microcystaceae cyanobacterium]
MKAQEKLVTERLYLVPLKLDLLKVAIIDIRELAIKLGVKVAPNWVSQEFIQAFPDIADILLQFPLQGEWGWGSLIIHQTDNTLIGHVMIKIIPDITGLPTDAIEIGYEVAPSYRQQGYASEATKAMMDWTLSQPGIQTVTAGCDPNNIASKRVLEKIGMDLIETREKVLVWKSSRPKVL